MGSEMVRAQPAGLAALEPRSLDELTRLAATCAGSGLFAVRSPEQAAVIMLTGASLGIAPVVALRSIHVVQGRAVLSSDLIAAIVRRSGLCESWRVDETTPERCTITTRRRGEEPYSHTWTLAMAQKASLAGKGTWAAYPAAMLRARCTAEIARIVFPDVLAGVYDESEIEEPSAQPDPRAVETIPAPEPTEDAVEEGSRALVAFEEQLTITDHLRYVPALWSTALDDLRGEGKAPEEWTSALADILSAWLTARGYRTLSAADRTALVAGHLSADLMAWHDDLANLLPLDASDRRLSDDEAARLAAETWLASRWSSTDQDTAKPARLALQRWMAAARGQAEDTKGAGTLLAATVQRLRAERAAAVDALTAAPSEPTRAREPGDDDDLPPQGLPPRKGRRKGTDASAPAEDTSWQGSREDMERHACGLRDVHAVRGSAIKHKTLVGYAAVLAARLQALDPGDEHGTRETYESALRRVNGWMASAQAAQRRAA